MARVGPDTVQIDDLFIPWNHFGGYYYDGNNQTKNEKTVVLLFCI
jgi:hypothetical protein